MSMLSLFLITVTAVPAKDHDKANPLYRELRDPGVAVGKDVKAPLPAPTMPDGLDTKAQREIIKTLAGQDYDLDDLLRQSVVAPHILRLRDLKPSDREAPVRGVDVWFVAYGDLKTVANKDFQERLLDSNRKESRGQALKTEDLAKRKITIKKEDEKHEGYGHVTFAFLDKIEISATGRAFWTQTDDSLLAATVLDPRFARDAEFPNQWRPLTRGDDGKIQVGPPNPYEGAAYYVKITRLAEPRGALFVECHVVFAEPVKWFDGANLLRSKLPAAVQTQVRAMRRELLKASQ